MDDELLRRVATHEAGHIAACITYGVPIISATVIDRPHVHRGPLRSALGLEIVGVICFSGPAAEELFCGPPSPGDDGSYHDFAMAYAHLERQVGALRRGLEFERLRDSARRLVRTPWARARVPLLAAALIERGTLSGEHLYSLLG
jgi:hypothetical protein